MPRRTAKPRLGTVRLRPSCATFARDPLAARRRGVRKEISLRDAERWALKCSSVLLDGAPRLHLLGPRRQFHGTAIASDSGEVHRCIGTRKRDLRRRVMIRRMRSSSSDPPRDMSQDAPSPEQIAQMTAEIRESWSPHTRVGRMAGAPRRVEIMVVSALAFADLRESV